MKRRLALFLLPLVLLGFFYAGKSIFSSAWYKKKDRINIVFYGQNTHVFSVDLSDEINYIIPVDSDVIMQIPGGYGDYRLGGLGKLVMWEKDTDLFRRVFSYNTMLMVDFYFYPKKNSIYYGSQNTDFKPSFSQIFFQNSNANLFDRIFIYTLFVGKGKRNFATISMKEKLFDRESFYKKFQGFFYQKQYRDKKANLQILYEKSYAAAAAVSGILEGQGIRVVDISQSSENIKNCSIEESAKYFSPAAKDAAQFFGCELRIGTPEISDIIIRLGEKEKKWEVEK